MLGCMTKSQLRYEGRERARGVGGRELKLNARRPKPYNNGGELFDDNLWIHPL